MTATSINNANKAIALGSAIAGEPLSWRKPVVPYSTLGNVHWSTYVTGIGAVVALVSAVAMTIFGAYLLTGFFAALFLTQAIATGVIAQKSSHATLQKITDRFTAIVTKIHHNQKSTPAPVPPPSTAKGNVQTDPKVIEELKKVKTELVEIKDLYLKLQQQNTAAAATKTVPAVAPALTTNDCPPPAPKPLKKKKQTDDKPDQTATTMTLAELTALREKRAQKLEKIDAYLDRQANKGKNKSGTHSEPASPSHNDRRKSLI